ncbi:twin-arginine translocase TatA/TatE family subunit [Candidatus Bathyarchaeota archaeon]|nr:MAG: twin-arginine translocase TatA/TatE family subunit [Candidatus Hecatellales archaeon]RLI34956.1 MAG: twin-arginine translocase TatA/TatE family subunit [Candidatus Bathyarchaeota archaeon]
MVNLANFLPTVQGMEWIILIAVIVIVLFGAKKLPELARSIGKATGEFEKGKAEAEMEVKLLKERLKEGKLSEETEKDKLVRIAKELGIETEGKSEEELREEITKAMMR